MSKAPNIVDAAIGGNLRRLRIMRGMSQEGLGKEVDLTFQQIQKYERGTNRVSGSRMVELCRVLDIELERLFEGIEVRGPVKLPTSDPISKLGETTWGTALAEAVIVLPPDGQRAVLRLCRTLAKLDRDQETTIAPLAPPHHRAARRRTGPRPRSAA